MNKETRKSGIILSISAIAVASPILINQILNIKKIVIDPAFEKYFCEYKTIDYILAIIGFVLTMRMPKKYLLFAAFFIASFVYLGYPSRFFSSEGYISIALLAAVSLNYIFEKSSKQKLFKAAAIFLIIFILIFSPTYAAQEGAAGIPEYRFFIFDSAVMDMLFPKTDERIISKTLWFKNYYDDAAQIIRKNSLKNDIVYCTTEVVGVCLASLSERATANHLLPEVYPPEKRDPFKDSAIIVTLKYNDPVWVKQMASKYDLILVGSNEMFDIYKNRNNCAKMKAKKALIPFGVFFLLLIGLLFPLCVKIKTKSKLH